MFVPGCLLRVVEGGGGIFRLVVHITGVITKGKRDMRGAGVYLHVIYSFGCKDIIVLIIR